MIQLRHAIPVLLLVLTGLIVALPATRPQPVHTVNPSGDPEVVRLRSRLADQYTKIENELAAAAGASADLGRTVESLTGEQPVAVRAGAETTIAELRAALSQSEEQLRQSREIQNTLLARLTAPAPAAADSAGPRDWIESGGTLAGLIGTLGSLWLAWRADRRDKARLESELAELRAKVAAGA